MFLIFILSGVLSSLGCYTASRLGQFVHATIQVVLLVVFLMIPLLLAMAVVAAAPPQEGILVARIVADTSFGEIFGALGWAIFMVPQGVDFFKKHS